MCNFNLSWTPPLLEKDNSKNNPVYDSASQYRKERKYENRSVCGISQFAGSSGPVPYTLRVFNGVKWVIRLESVVGLGLACELVLRLR